MRALNKKPSNCIIAARLLWANVHQKRRRPKCQLIKPFMILLAILLPPLVLLLLLILPLLPNFYVLPSTFYFYFNFHCCCSYDYDYEYSRDCG